MKKFIFAALLCLSQLSHAELTATDAKNIAVTIGSFFGELHRGDADAVFAMQTKSTRDYFVTAAAFVGALKECCSALHNVDSATMTGLLELKTKNETLASALIKDKSGAMFGAVFTVQKQAGTWKIDECHIQPIEVGDKGKSI